MLQNVVYSYCVRVVDKTSIGHGEKKFKLGLLGWLLRTLESFVHVPKVRLAIQSNVLKNEKSGLKIDKHLFGIDLLFYNML